MSVYDLVIDVETKKLFEEVGGFFPEKLGVSYLGAWAVEEGKGVEKSGWRGFLEGDLRDFWPLAERARSLVGFNLLGFDLPALSFYYPGDFGRFQAFDLMEEIRKVWGRRVSLGAVAKGSLGEQKNGDGLGAVEYFRQGDFKNLALYCKKDVELTAKLFVKARDEEKLCFQDHWNEFREVEVKFSPQNGVSKEKGNRVQMTLGL